MLKVIREQNGSVLTVILSGVIDENTDLDKLIYDPGKFLLVNCRRIERINSAGIRSWMRFFKALSYRGVKFKFLECSPAIVESINVIPGFTAGGEIESIYVPYTCTGCHTGFVQLNSTPKLKLLFPSNPPPGSPPGKLPDIACPKCGKQAVFDEETEDYLGFLKGAA